MGPVTRRLLSLSLVLLLALCGCRGGGFSREEPESVPLPAAARVEVYAYRLRQEKTAALSSHRHWLVQDNPRIEEVLLQGGEFPFLDSSKDLRLGLYGIWTWKGQPTDEPVMMLALSPFTKSRSTWTGTLVEGPSPAEAEAYKVVVKEEKDGFKVESLKSNPLALAR